MNEDIILLASVSNRSWTDTLRSVKRVKRYSSEGFYVEVTEVKPDKLRRSRFNLKLFGPKSSTIVPTL